MIQSIIDYLQETYTLTKEDLALPDDERNFLLGQLAMIDELKDIAVNGIPSKDEPKDEEEL